MFLPAHIDPKTDMTHSVELSTDSLEAPVEKGMVCGSVTFRLGDEAVITEAIVTKEYIPKSSFEVVKSDIASFLKSKFFIVIIVLLILSIPIIILIRYIIKRKRRV